MATHRRPAQPGLVRATRGALLCAAAAAAVVYATVPAGAAPQESPGDVKARVDRLYQQAEQATESYDAAQERSVRLRSELETLQGELARGQQSANALRDALGKAAGAWYRNGGVDPAIALMLSSDPDNYLDRAATLERIDSRWSGRLRALQSAERVLTQERDQANARLSELDRLRGTLDARKRTVQGKLADARRLLDGLAAAQRAAIGFEAADPDRPGSPGPGSAPGSGAGAAPDLPALGPIGSRAAEAVAAAKAALGSPYAWGSAGPGAFDCSGLMYWAYQHAGTTLPRTSQEQMSAGHRVPLGQARPGDLVIYRSDASHVGMYVGGGKVIHAPYPGARVRYDSVGMLPVAAVVRP